jgi:hypothetical protein
MVASEKSVYHCDHCGTRIGEAPIAERGGYFMACTVAARGDNRPLWMAELCSDCMNELREWADGSLKVSA